MPVQPEPILDIVRGLSTVASFAIVVNQLQNLYESFFVSSCHHCRGTGTVTCPHCHGTKTLRRRAGFLRTRDLAIVDNPKDSYLCYYCGPHTKFDFNPMAADDEQTALKVQENLKAAVANLWPKPFDLGALAGTVPCPQCHGNPRIRRLTPDFGKALDLGDKWDFKLAKRLGQKFFFTQPEARNRRQFLEYPGAPPVTVELPAPKPVKSTGTEAKGAAAEEGGFKLSHSNAFSLEDYVLNYASDDDEPAAK